MIKILDKKYKVVLFCVILSSSAYLLSDLFTFFKACYTSPQEVGACMPSSNFVARELGRYLKLDNSNHARHYLEIGCGTGDVTEVLASMLGPSDCLDAIEINSELAAIAKKRLAKYPQVKIHCCSILDWKSKDSYDAVVSTLPFNIFSLEFVRNIMVHVHSMMKPCATFSYIEYMWFAKFKQCLLQKDQREKFKAMYTYLQRLRKQYLVSKESVVCNLPPLYVYHLRFGSDENSCIV